MMTPRTLLVTGASGGIGLAISESLLAQGHTIIGIARHHPERLCQQSGYHAITADLAKLANLSTLGTQLLATYPAIDGAVFSAGQGRFGTLEQFSCQQIEALFQLNFLSIAFLVRQLLPTFRKRTLADLVFIGSEASLIGGHRGAIYSASKFALRGFAQSLRREAGTVRVSLVNPGMVRTAFYDNTDFQPGDGPEQALQPQDVAAAVLLVLAARAGVVFDEINLSPAKKVIVRKKQGH